MRKTAKDVIAEVARARGVSTTDITGSNRSRLLVQHRQEAAFEIYVQCPHLSYPAIGNVLGQRDHTTAIWSVKKHCERLGVPYAAVRRTTNHYKATAERNTRIGLHPQSPADYREAARL